MRDIMSLFLDKVGEPVNQEKIEWEMDFRAAVKDKLESSLCGQKEEPKKGESYRRGYQAGIKDEREVIIKEVDKKISELLQEFANTPIKDRKNAWDYLVECRPKLLSLLSDKETKQ